MVKVLFQILCLKNADDKKMDKIFKIVELLHKYKAGKLEPLEKADLDAWLNEEGNREWADGILADEYEVKALSEFRKYSSDRVFRHLTDDASRRRIRFRWLWGAAAFLPVAITVAVFLKKENLPEKNSTPVALQIPVGGSKAVLTLPGGATVLLGKEHSDYVRNAQTVLVRADSANLVYEEKSRETEQLVYNELYVPRRGEYSLQLSDGTRVFLNADSRLKYPEAFGKGQREVELSGEAYFEVSRDVTRPFIVKVGDMRVRVLGTVFNINAYGEYPEIRTTLVNGKVNVECPGKVLELLPGEQACLDRFSQLLHKEKVNVALYTAWKDGLFKFERESLENIMTILERWYDVHVFFRNDALKNSLFSGDLRKYDTIEQHLKMLELTTNVKFCVQGHIIFIGYNE